MKNDKRYLAPGALLLALFLLLGIAGTARAQFSFGAKPAAKTNSAATNTAATNQTAKTNIVYNPQNDEEKRTFMLRAFIDNADEVLIRDVVKMFKIPETGDLRELKSGLKRYLGLVAMIQDSRKPSEVLVQDVFRSPDMNNNFVVYADEGVHIRSEKDANAGLITLRGDNGNLNIKFKEQTISARLIRLDMKRREIFGEGRATIREKDRVIIGDKFYFNSESKYGVIYDAQTYMAPYYYYGKKIKKVGEQNYILDDGWFTTCDADPPHFSFGVSKAWLYQDTRLVALNVDWRVSDSSIFWFPFLFHPMSGTGFWTGLTRDTRVGWILQVGNAGQMLGLPFDMSFDFYQRLGIALLGNKEIKDKNWSVGIKAGLAYDKPLDQVNGNWVNEVDGNNKAGDESGDYGDWKRDLRWKIELEPKFTILHDDNNPAAGSTSFAFSFNLMSDPFFKGEFESKRETMINFEKLQRPEIINNYSRSEQSTRTWTMSLSDTRGGNTLSLNGSWNFQTVANTNQLNEFANDYRKYNRSSITFPSISYSLSGNILSSSPNANTNIVNTSTNRGRGKNDVLALDEAADRKRDEDEIGYSIAYDARAQFTITRSYDYQTDKLDTQDYERTLKGGITSRFNVGTLFNTHLVLGLSDTDKWGTGTNASAKANYKQKTYMTEDFGFTLADSYNKGKLTEFGYSFGVTQGLSYRMYDDPTDVYNKDVTGHSTSGSLTFNFFRTTATFSTAYDLTEAKNETRSQGRDRFSPLSFSLNSTPFDFLAITESYGYTIKTDKATANTLGVTIKSPEFALPFIDKIAGLNLGFSWTHNYESPLSSQLTLSLAFLMQISDLWSVKISLGSYNNQLYRYSSEYAAMYGKEQRSLLRDLVNSLMFWDSNRLKDTYFIAQSLTLELMRDLHNWQMGFTAGISQQKSTSGRRFSYYNMNFSFEIRMKSNIGITIPQQKYQYTADSDGKYFGTYTFK